MEGQGGRREGTVLLTLTLTSSCKVLAGRGKAQGYGLIPPQGSAIIWASILIPLHSRRSCGWFQIFRPQLSPRHDWPPTLQ